MPLEMDSRLRALVNTEAPLDLVWQWMVELGLNLVEVNTTAQFYADYEEVLVELEVAIHRTFFDLYGDLAEGCQASSPLEWVKKSPAEVFLFCDGFSIREAVLLAHRLRDAQLKNRRVSAKIQGYRFSGLPSNTSAWRQGLWPTSTPLCATDDFLFYEMSPGKDLSLPPLTKPAVIWYPLPDHGLHQTERRYGTTAEEVFDKLAQDIERLLDTLPPVTVYITGDHGYLYVPGAQYRWGDGGDGGHDTEYQTIMTQALKYGRSVPAEELDPRSAKIATGWKWYRVLMKVREHALLLGRYWVPRGGAPDVCHGGISLPECLVPVLEMLTE